MNRTLYIFFVAALISFCSGILGALLTTVYTVPFLSQPVPSLIERGVSDKRPIDTDRIPTDVNPSIVQVVENVGKKLEYRGHGVFISSDGWILLHQQNPIRQQSFRIIDHKNVVYSISTIVYDETLPLLYVRIATKNAKPAELFQDSITTTPMPGFLIKGSGSIQKLFVTPLGYLHETITDGIQKPTMLLKRFNYQEQYVEAGIPVFSVKGELVGFTATQGILPVSTVRRSVLDVFRNKKIERATIPVEYRDAAWETSQEGAKKIEGGALLAGSHSTVYRLKGLDGTSIRLFGGDSITQVNDEVLDRNRNLSEVLLAYRIKDHVSITVLQKGEKKTFEIILEDQNLYK